MEKNVGMRAVSQSSLFIVLEFVNYESDCPILILDAISK